MELLLNRRWATDKSTIGALAVDGAPECFILELPGQHAIPLGRYRVIINHSPRFGIEMPMLLDVPGRQGIRIHTGNWPHDTEGCLLTGTERGEDCVFESRQAFERLFPKLEASVEPIFITIAKGAPDV